MADWTTFTDPALLRIALTTTATPDLDASEAAYRDYLGYRVVERGTVAQSLAESWNAPAAAGSRTITMAAEGEDDVFARLIEVPAPAGYLPLTSFGWNAFEIIVDDVDGLATRLEGSPFTVIGEPAPLQFMPSIKAMQVTGPGNECLYFTMESGDRETSILPPPSGFVGRTFIVVAGGPNFEAMLRFYVDTFQLRERPVRQSKVGVLQRAQGLDSDQAIPLSAIGMAERGNLLELDGYPHGPGLIAKARPRATGNLPPGNALASFEVADLEPYVDRAFAPPEARTEAAYFGRWACSFLGPGGELVELIERKEPT